MIEKINYVEKKQNNVDGRLNSVDGKPIEKKDRGKSWLKMREEQTEMQQQAELFAQRQRELDRQTARDRAEEARRDSAVLKSKLFGDAMRASAIRMGVDPIEAIPFFQKC